MFDFSKVFSYFRPTSSKKPLKPDYCRLPNNFPI